MVSKALPVVFPHPWRPSSCKKSKILFSRDVPNGLLPSMTIYCRSARPDVASGTGRVEPGQNALPALRTGVKSEMVYRQCYVPVQLLAQMPLLTAVLINPMTPGLRGVILGPAASLTPLSLGGRYWALNTKSCWLNEMNSELLVAEFEKDFYLLLGTSSVVCRVI